MQLIITDAASKWFQQKFNLASGNGVKFYGVVKQFNHTMLNMVLSKGINQNRRSMRQQSS